MISAQVELPSSFFSILLPPQIPAQSWIQSLEISVSHTPQLSSVAEPFTVPAQSVQVLLSPSQTPQASFITLPPQAPVQSCTQSLEVSVSHVPQLSVVAVPFGVLAQSKHASVPPQTPQRSVLFVEQKGSVSVPLTTH